MLPTTEGQRMHHPTLSSAVTRRIWGSPDAILLFFADPTGAADAVERINRIHRSVEEARGEEIPQWAYRDMLFILIDYGKRAHEVVFGPMTEAERASHFGVGLALGRAMHLSGLPSTYAAYRVQRHQQLLEDYARGPLTDDLYASYCRALGPWRYRLLRLVQASVLPEELRDVLRLEPHPLVDELLQCYRFVPGGGNKLRPLHGVLLPGRFAKRLRDMERAPDAPQ